EGLRERIGTQGGPGIMLATVRTRVEPGIVRTLEQFAADQVAEHRRLEALVAGMYGARDRAWWRRRYETNAERLRGLVPTARYSTFVRHSAADLAEAFTAAGWHARVLIEPDDRSHLSSVAYLRELAAFQPDLVVLINYTREGLRKVFP